MLFDRILNSAVALVILGGATFMSWDTLRKGWGEPYVYHDVDMRPSFKADEPLTVTYVGTRYRVCRTDVERYILTTGNDMAWKSSREPATINPPTGKPLAVRIKLDVKLPPGEYVLHSVAVSECPDGNYYQRSPTAKFTVER